MPKPNHPPQRYARPTSNSVGLWGAKPISAMQDYQPPARHEYIAGPAPYLTESEKVCLAALRTLPQPFTVAQVAEASGASPQAVAVLVRGLNEVDLLWRVPETNLLTTDRRMAQAQ